MEIIATNSSPQSEPIPAGNYPARCYGITHLGTITEEYLGEAKTANRVRLTWELPTELKVFKPENGEQPQVISKEYTLSMHEKASLRHLVESWRGKGLTNDEAAHFDVVKLAGAACMLNIIHKAKTDGSGNMRADISSISALMKGYACPAQVNPTQIFSVTEFDQAAFDKFPDFVKDKIKSSKEYKAMQAPNIIDPVTSDEAYQIFPPKAPVIDPDDLPFT
jgi:hypothetical protein